MTPTTMFDLKAVTKEWIVESFCRSLASAANHILLRIHGPNPSMVDVESDFACWYGGVTSLARAIDPTVHLFGTDVMVTYIRQNFDQIKTTIEKAA